MTISTLDILHLCTIAGIAIDKERSDLSDENMNAKFILHGVDVWVTMRRETEKGSSI